LPRPIEHFVIPDTQCKPGVPLDHLTAAGNYIVDKQPDVIIHMGDHWDMPSLSSYDKGTKRAEGTRYEADIEAGIKGMEALMDPIIRYNRTRLKKYKPRKIFLIGNHEQRIERHVNENPNLYGKLSYKDFGLEKMGWEVHDFLEVVEVDGISYSHYFYNPMTGNAWTGRAATMLSNVGFSFTMGHRQGKDQAEKHLANGRTIRGLVCGCLTPDHMVLMADLQYKPIGDLIVGDRIVSFEEEPNPLGKRSRRYKTGTVIDVRHDIDDVYEVSLKSGKAFKVTKDHVWLVKTGSMYRWTTTDRLRRGTVIPKLLDEWDALSSYEAGWLSGMYDGEGHLYARITTGGNAMQMGISQKTGPILDRISALLASECGQKTTCDSIHNDVKSIRIIGGTTNIAKVLGMLRPARLLQKFKPEMLGSICCSNGRNDSVSSIKYIGKRTIVRSNIDEKTMIVEGYPHHNSFYQHDEDYKGPQGNHHWRGCIYKHEVKDGNYDLMELSLSYLLRKWR